MSEIREIGNLCDARDCYRRPVWVFIGEGGDFYLCSIHGREAPGWQRITDNDVGSG